MNVRKYILPISLTVLAVIVFIAWKEDLFKQGSTKNQTKPPVCHTYDQKFTSNQLPVWNGLNCGWLSVNLAGSGDLCDCRSGMCGEKGITVCE